MGLIFAYSFAASLLTLFFWRNFRTRLAHQSACERFPNERDQQLEQLGCDGEGGFLPHNLILSKNPLEALDTTFRAHFGAS